MLDDIYITAALLAVFIGGIRWYIAGQSATDMTRYDERESDFDFNLLYVFLVIFVIAGAVWLLAGGFTKPI